MRDFNNITIVAIYGHENGASAIHSLLASASHLNGAKILLLSIERPPHLDALISWKRIYPLDYQQYNLFIFHCLYQFIDTDFALIVQDDGWVINGEMWQDYYYECDYIGAPCHAAFINGELKLNYSWINHEHPTIIQNGGLSLRSKKLLNAPNRLGLTYKFNPFYNEDVLITGLYKPDIENEGIVIATTESALYFSVEYLGPKIHDNFNFQKLFGIHGQTRKLLANKIIEYKTTEEVANSIYGEKELLNYLISIGYKINFINQQ